MPCIRTIVDMITFPSPPSSYTLASHRELFFVQNGKIPIPCMLYSIRAGAPLLIVYCHSNGCDIGDMHAALLCMAESFHCHVLSFEFPGYGLHEGKSSMETIDKTCTVLLDYIENVLHVDLRQVVWFGRSIGSGPAINMANVVSSRGIRPAGLIVQCGFCNFKEVARFLFGRVAKRLVAHKWNNEGLIAAVKCPVLILHGKKDKMIPYEHAERLWNAVENKERSRLILCFCGHNDFNFNKCTLRPIHKFLYTLTQENPPELIGQLTVPTHCRPIVSHVGMLRLQMPPMTMKRYNLDQIEKVRSHSAAANQALTSRIDRLAGFSAAGVEQTDEKGIVSSVPLNGQGVQRTDDANNAPDPGQQPETDNVVLDFRKPISQSDAANEKHGTHRTLKITGIRRKPDKKEAKGRKGRKRCACVDSNKKMDVCIVCYEADCTFYRKGINPGDVNNLLNVRALVHALTARLVIFLYALRNDLELEIAEHGSLKKDTPLEQVVDWVEAQLWIRDPFLNLYEELVWADGTVKVEYAFGPYRLTQTHWEAKEYDGKRISPTDSCCRTRIPVWCYLPAPLHFRCITEWILCSSKKLREIVPEPVGAESSKQTVVREKAQTAAPDDCAAAFASRFIAWVSEPRARITLDKIGNLCGGSLKASTIPLQETVPTKTARPDAGGLSYWLRPLNGGLPPFRQLLERENQSPKTTQYVESALMNPSVQPCFLSEEEILALFSAPSQGVHIARNADFFAANVLKILENLPRIPIGSPLVSALNRSMQFFAKNSVSSASTQQRAKRNGAKPREEGFADPLLGSFR